jgi:Coenzyme PQQ synthesis protein D (PqqD)
MSFSTSVPMLVSRQFGDEVVLANYSSGVYYNLDGTGAQIWLGIDAGKTVEQIVDGFSATADADRSAIDRGVRAFVDHLLAEGIIIPGQPASRCKDWSPLTSGAFSVPQLERFDDLRDLLLLDPIHDVGENGWPLRGGDAG